MLEVRAAVALVTTTAIVAVSVGTRGNPAQIAAFLGRDAAAAGADLTVCAGARAIRVTRATSAGITSR